MISNEDFGVLVEELLGRERISYDMLCLLAERELRPLVRRLCRSEPCLRGRDLENDIMQEINIRLIKTAISHFLLREGCDSQINYDPIGFRKWMVTVAINIKNDYANRERRHDFKNLPIDENVLSGEYDEISISDDGIEMLQAAFSIVMASDVKVYKVLTWVAQMIFIISFDISKIQSNEMIVSAFREKTLFEMYGMLLSAGKAIPWLTVSEEQNKKIEAALNSPWDEKTVFGNVKYKDFFMKKGGKYSISDWVNRMNNMIKQVMKNATLNN